MFTVKTVSGRNRGVKRVFANVRPARIEIPLAQVLSFYPTDAARHSILEPEISKISNIRC